LQRRYGLKLYRADKSLAEHGSLAGDVGDALKAEVAREWIREHTKKVKSGMSRAMKDGKAVGRPPKLLSKAEVDLVMTMRAEGEGWRSIAHAVSTARGAFKVADPARRRALTVSHSHVRRVMERRA
jgi:DNA invertase Pin-like site-specific DNA recombinase